MYIKVVNEGVIDKIKESFVNRITKMIPIKQIIDRYIKLFKYTFTKELINSSIDRKLVNEIMEAFDKIYSSNLTRLLNDVLQLFKEKLKSFFSNHKGDKQLNTSVKLDESVVAIKTIIDSICYTIITTVMTVKTLFYTSLALATVGLPRAAVYKITKIAKRVNDITSKQLKSINIELPELDKFNKAFLDKNVSMLADSRF